MRSGRVERALDPADAERAVDALLAEDVEAIAVCLINSFANPAHELTIKEIVQAQGAAACRCSVSFEVLPEIKEYERTSTTVDQRLCHADRRDATCARCAPGSMPPASRRRCC